MDRWKKYDSAVGPVVFFIISVLIVSAMFILINLN